VEKLIKNYIPKKVIEYGGVSLAFNNVENHIHLLCHISPKISVSEFVNKIKGSSSRYINVLDNDQNFYWQNGYGILSVSKKNIPFVKKYIINQKQHHKNHSLINSLERANN